MLAHQGYVICTQIINAKENDISDPCVHFEAFSTFLPFTVTSQVYGFRHFYLLGQLLL